MKIIILFISLLTISRNSLAQNNHRTFNNMITLSISERLILMDIFEVSMGNGTSNDKPARISLQEAKNFCENRGKRLPTLNEWMIAASNYGKNKSYSLRYDRLKDDNNVYIPNINSRFSYGSQRVFEIDNIGIDAIGTVALTGNRYEWVMDENGNSYVCGGEYETSDISLLHLNNICHRNIAEVSRRRNATTRCVYDIKDDESITLKLNEYVNAELRNYLEDLYFFDSNGQLLLDEIYYLDDILVGLTPYSTMPNDDEDRLDYIWPEDE